MKHVHIDPELSIEDLRAAMSDMQTYIDITPEDLHTLYALALGHARARRSSEKAVQTIMTTEVVTLPHEADLHEAAHVLSEHQISGAPVINAHRHVIGVVSDADLLALVGMPREHTFRDLVRHLLGRPLPLRKTGTTVAEIMTVPAITVQPDTTIREAAQLLSEHRIKRLPVVDGEQRLVGIVSRADIVKVLTTL
jgi:CBS-domain-containing membrane protein